MDLQSFLAVIWRRRLVVGITTALALCVTIAGLFLITPEYAASTTLRMGTANTGSSGYVSYDLQYTDRLMNTYRTIVTSPQTSAQVMKQLNLSAPPKISVSIPANTELMVIEVQDTNPTQAAAAANAIATQLSNQIEAQYASLGESSLDILKQQIDQLQADLTKERTNYDNLLKATPQNADLISATLQSIQLDESTYSNLLTQYQQTRDATAQGASKMTVVQAATVPTAPSNPNKKILIPLGMILGFIGGTGLAFLLENFDTTLHSTEEIAKLVELPVIGRIPATKRTHGTMLYSEKSPQEEAFRRLRTTLFALDPDSGIRSMMITSSEPAEGKSTTVANLALAIAQAGRRVIVVDGDLRKPAMHRAFNVSNSVGLSNVLSRDIALEEAIQYSMIPGVHVLSSGPASPTPAELLGLPVMQDVIAELTTQFDFVLVDTPSLQTVADAVVLSLIVDRLVVVVARGSARREKVDAALKELAGVHQVPLGIIVSHAEVSSDFHYDRPADGNRASTTPSEPSARPRQNAGPQLRVINPSQTGTTEQPSRPNQHNRLDRANGDTPETDGIDGHASHESAVLRRIG
ncbi:MAG TPA: polysaccharide biosynthesis tyrosine autokinase [Nitrolancea sp.]|nr:polysaccharide biosynthesis tyrosine autokinase [Nitrolancea sp.]